MRTDDLLDQCLQALTSGEDLPPDIARYLARHPEQRAEVEELLFVAQRVSHLPPAELSRERRQKMQSRLARRLNFEPSLLDAQVPAPEWESQEPHASEGRKRAFPVGRLPLARLHYEPPPTEDPSEASIREVFRGLTPEDIRRYIGVRGEDYLYYRRGLPGWEPVFTFLAVLLRGFKRLERLMASGLGQ